MNWFLSLIRSTENLGRILVSFYRRIRRPVSSAICRGLISLHINQSHLTLSRMFLMIVFYFAWVSSFFIGAFILLVLVFILDCLDGDLSRMLGHDTPLGEFEDVMGDNLACLIFPLALIQTGQLKGVLGALFIFSAFAVLWLANPKKPLSGNSSELLFWPKGDLFLTLARKVIWIVMYLFLLFRISIFDSVYAGLSIVLCISTAVHYYQIIKSRL
jgi:phosphatidylglycerophosphate synthase